MKTNVTTGNYINVFKENEFGHLVWDYYLILNEPAEKPTPSEVDKIEMMFDQMAQNYWSLDQMHEYLEHVEMNCLMAGFTLLEKKWN